MKEYLPIGSIVLLKEAEKRIMIIGFAQEEAETGKIWDYSAVLYPEGMFELDNFFFFNADQIQAIFFMGFQDAEGMQFLDALSNLDDAQEFENNG